MDTPQTSSPPTDAEMAFGLAGLVPPIPAPPAAPETDAPVVRWLGEKQRVARHELEHPFVLDGIVYRVILVMRLTAGEVEAFTERLRADPAKTSRFPMFHLVTGEPETPGAEISDAAWAALDDDDRFALEEIADRFLPARFKRRPDAS